jgi:hexosaminidase
MVVGRSMRTTFIFVLFFLMVAATMAAAQARPMPLPRKVVVGRGALPIDSSFAVTADGCADQRMAPALRRLRARIARQTGLPITSGGKMTLTVTCHAAGAAYPTLGEDESYRLDITAEGARLTAETGVGALRGLETFAQLIVPGPRGFQIVAVHIEDQPRFPWRGLMLDVSRHWMPATVVERNLEAMAAVKMNVFHWHLSDDQGFRVGSKRFPKLQALGSDGNFYTQEEVRRVVAHAAELGIRVIPEFDMPGHTTSWFAAYPELASASGTYSIERAWGIFKPTMDPSREETYTFLDAFLGEMTALFPDPCFHIGGDEVDDSQWKHSETLQAFAKHHSLANSHEVQAYFNRRVQALLKKYGKTMVGWDEVLDGNTASALDGSTIIQSWRGPASLAEAARHGYRGLLSSGFYLDHLKPAGFHYTVDPLSSEAGAAPLDDAQAARILGGEACMWSEYVSPETVDSRIWPRAAAIAERLWSAREVRDVAAMYARLTAVSRTLEALGVEHRANYAPMLDRLADGQPAEPLRVLAEAVEPLGIEGRRDTRKYTSMVPLNRLVDAARPESESVYRLEMDVRKLVSPHSYAGELATPEVTELRAALTEWTSNELLLAAMVQDNFLLAELKPVSRNLSAVGAIGLRALEYLQSGQNAPPDWLARQTETLGQMETPSAEVSLAAVRPVRLLLEALVSRSGAGFQPAGQVGNLSH